MKMNKISEKNEKILNAAAVALFVLCFAACAFFGNRDVLGTLFTEIGIGEPLKMPFSYTTVCFLFFGLLVALAVVGFIIKSRLMLFLSGVYELLFIAAFVMLGFAATGNISGEGFFKAVTYAVTAVLIPVYGVIWSINLFFFVLFVPLFVFNVVAIVKTFKK